MSSAFDITQAVNPPRAAFLDFPLGHTTGKPHDPELQREILLDALKGLSAATPGTVRRLPFRWDDTEAWKDLEMKKSDDRQIRYGLPQYQCEADRQLAEANT